MKRKITSIILIIMLIVSLMLLTGCVGTKEKGVDVAFKKEIFEVFGKFFEGKETVEEYSLEYNATYNTSSVLDTDKQYKVIENYSEFNEVLDKISNEFSNSNASNSMNEWKFNKEFFENKNVLVVEGGIGSTINNIEVKENKIDVQIYCATPLTTEDTTHTFNLYFIPINKGVNDVSVDISGYPDRLY